MSEFGEYEDQAWLPELYDLVPTYVGRADLDFYLQYCRDTDGKILELGCGTGRILIPAARAGVTITGLDLSEHMLSRCRRKLQKESQEVQNRVQLVPANMVGFKLDRTFELAIIPFRPFQHLVGVSDQIGCLQSVHRHLSARGKLILDVFQVNLGMINNPRRAEETEDVPELTLPDGRRMRRTHRTINHHRAEQYLDVELIYYLSGTDGKTERLVQAFPFRYFFRYEIEHLLARCGFAVVDLFGDFDKSPLENGSPEMIFVAEECESA